MTDNSTKHNLQSSRAAYITRVITLGILLVAAWLFWSGFFKPLLLGLGAFSCILVLYLSHRMRLFDSDIFALRFSFRLFRFWGWLGKEIFLSSLEVARIVLNPKLPISPTVIKFDTVCDHKVDQAILGNSITLTPGTLTLNIEGMELTVHSLTRQGALDLQSGEMERRVAALRQI
jgi:multicomponent Na+:H+ antiporter subunit E